MLAYFVFTFISYKDRVQVSYYEVEEGSLVREHKYTGLILRQEEIFGSEANGYIYYYVADGRKVAKGSPVYSIDEGGQLMNYLNSHSDELSELDASRVADIRAEMLGYSRAFDPSDFRTLYNIKNTLDAHTIEYASMGIFSTISDDLAVAGINFKEFRADRTGVVCCYTDGYEGVSEENISETLFDRDSYNKVNVKSGELVSVGETVYKMITDEKWELVFRMTDEDIEEFNNSVTLKVNFPDKNFSVRSKFRMITGADSRHYGVLEMDSYTVQFTSDRFVDFEIVTNDVSGLKIPVKALTTKDLYIVPVDYLQTDSNGNKGFYKAVVSGTGTGSEFVMPEIYNMDNEYCYLDCDDAASPLKPGDFIMLTSSSGSALPPPAASQVSDESDADAEAEEDADAVSNEEEAAEAGENESTSSESGSESVSESVSGSDSVQVPVGTDLYQIAAKKSVDGVYNVNKGYAVFKRAEVLETANGYSIVKKNTSYGLQVYDHIVLDASMVHDGQLLYR